MAKQAIQKHKAKIKLFLRRVAASVLCIGLLAHTPRAAAIDVHTAKIFHHTHGQIEVPLVVRQEDCDALPNNYRSSRTPLPQKSLQDKGLQTLRIAGCAQFSEKQFDQLLKQLAQDFPGLKPSDVYIFDLRGESHGFIEGHAVEWYVPRWNDINDQLETTQVKIRERVLLNTLKDIPHVLAYGHETLKFNKGNYHVYSTERIANEQELVQRSGAHYIRIAVTDHSFPAEVEVDLFIAEMTALPPNAVAVFHCRAGKGRTTTFMSMMDMWRNADKLSFDEIVERQSAMGLNVSLKSVEKDQERWRQEKAQTRLKRLKAFYEFARQHKLRATTSFSAYLKGN